MLIANQRNDKWHQINFRNVETLLSAEFILDLYDQYVSDINIFRYRNVSVFFSGNKVFSYTPQKDWEYIIRMISKMFLKLDADTEKSIIYYAKREKKKLYRLWEKIESDELQIITDEELGELLYQWYYTTLNDIFKLNLAPVEHGITEAIKIILKQMGASNVDEEVATLLSFNTRTNAVQEEYDLLKLCNENEKEVRKDDLNEHWRKYRSLRCAYGNSPWELDYFYERAKAIQSKGKVYISSRLEEIEKYPKMIATQRQNCLKKYNNVLLAKLSDLGCMIGELRDRNKAILGKSITYRDTLIKLICSRRNMDTSEVKYYFLSELVDLIDKGEKVTSEEIEKREKGVLLETGLTKKTDIAAKNVLYMSILTNETGSISKFNGTCASKGKTTGKVKICHTSDECRKVNHGDILVAYGTDFDFIEAMEKASAILTEEGGMLSHASVISRETGKPCIIGVHGIMGKLHDGDFVMVDAEVGEITLLNNEKNERYLNRNPYVYDWTEIDQDLFCEVGGKAYNLAKLYNLGYPILKGIVLGTKYFYKCISDLGIEQEFANAEKEMLQGNNLRMMHIIDKLNIDLLELGFNFEAGESYAVRSSGIQEDGEKDSFAGQHYTALFCHDEKEITDGIRNAWKSFYSESVMLYRKKKNIPCNNMAGAVIIQKMLKPDCSGVMFTKNPINQNKEIIIEVCNGQCFQVVDGIVTPSRYYINPQDRNIIQFEERNGVMLDNSIISNLVEIAVMLDEQMGKDGLDIEWGISDEKVYILQVRPITT